MLQPRFERRAGNSAMTLLEQPRFRAGLDFLRLRGVVGEADLELAVWWEAFFQANDEERRDMLDAVREPRSGPRRVTRAAPAPGEAGAVAPPAPPAGGDEEAVPADAGAPRKRRRRRRRPSESGDAPS